MFAVYDRICEVCVCSLCLKFVFEFAVYDRVCDVCILSLCLMFMFERLMCIFQTYDLFPWLKFMIEFYV